MKLLLRITLIAALVFLSGCSSANASGEPADAQASASVSEPASAPQYDETTEVVEITEKLFVAQSNEVYLNPGDYLGKIIHYEGIFVTFENPGADEVSHTVIRYGPGCCGIDANCGFKVVWPNGQGSYPQEDDWVEVTGVLEEYEAYGYQQLQVSLISLRVLDVRGAEYVVQ
jgi:uncharacterized membrane protein YcgQ (UPF0703/DUF1980 family)